MFGLGIQEIVIIVLAAVVLYFLWSGRKKTPTPPKE